MFIVDFQGFECGSSGFLCREIAILNCENNFNQKHAFVDMPINIRYLNAQMSRQINWLTNNSHGLTHTNIVRGGGAGEEYDDLKMEHVSEWLNTFIRNNQNGLPLVAVKGLQKKEWLANLLRNVSIINLEDEGCPNLENLRSLFKSFHCNNHFINGMNCSKEIVNHLYCWYTFCKRNE